jgi:hypothetical protein
VSCYDAKKLKSESLSHARCASGLHKKGELCYSECAAGFTNTGVSCYRGPDTVAKKSRGRGAGSPMKCRPGEEEDAGLCYPACKAGFSGVGPVCWQGCPAARINCGAGCASGRTACVADIGNMVVAPATLAYNIATFGSAAYAGKYLAVVSALKAAARARAAGNAALQAGVTVKLWVDDFAAHFDKMTTPEVKRQIEMRFSPRAQEWIKRQYALNHLHLMLTRDVVETDLRELSAISGFDPSGVTGVISAFAKPICSSADPFPSVRAFY